MTETLEDLRKDLRAVGVVTADLIRRTIEADFFNDLDEVRIAARDFVAALHEEGAVGVEAERRLAELRKQIDRVEADLQAAVRGLKAVEYAVVALAEVGE